MIKRASLEQWKELFEVTLRIRDLKPWEYLWDMDLIAIQDDTDMETAYCSIMGHGGACSGITVYMGEEGIKDFNMILLAEETDLPIRYIMYEHSSLTCYFGDREEVPPEQKKAMKELGLRFRGKGNWPYFLSYKKRYAPHTPDAEEVGCLINIYHHLYLALKQIREEQLGRFLQDDMILKYFYDKTSGTWKIEKEERPRLEHEYPLAELTDDVLKRRLKKRPKTSADISIDFTYLNATVTDKKYERPVNPLLMLAVDNESYEIIEMRMLEPDVSEIDAVFNFFIDFVLNNGKMRVIRARNPWVISALQLICEYCDVCLSADDLEMMDELILEMQEHFSYTGMR